MTDFNPRSPHRERQYLEDLIKQNDLFQSTLPSQGATTVSVTDTAGNVDFNPRSPHRERRLVSVNLVKHNIFQSTLPSQGATRGIKYWRILAYISIHAPLTGSDYQLRRCNYVFDISIHAPLTGSDLSVSEFPLLSFQFQSTLPSQGATYFDPEGLLIFCGISIHAPLTGSDLARSRVILFILDFNPRSPHRERREE